MKTEICIVLWIITLLDWAAHFQEVIRWSTSG
jgi:hypothetical protein